MPATTNTSLHDISISHINVSFDALEEVVVLVESGRSRKLTAFSICGGIALTGTRSALLMAFVAR
jgi:sulfopyruvate decarboxylase TPP-binding subunit